MIKDNTVYFNYEGYKSRYGGARRPALLRYSTRIVPGTRYDDDEEISIVTLYFDGKIIENRNSTNRDGYSVAIVELINSKYPAPDELRARPFNATSIEDWNCLFYDTSEFHRMGDRLAYAIIAIALSIYNINIPIITAAINKLSSSAKQSVIDLINYSSYSLSVHKIHQINELNRVLGNPSNVFFPKILEDAAKLYDITGYDSFNVHSLTDKLFELSNKKEIKNPQGFPLFIHWLNNDSATISLQLLNSCFAYLGEEQRSLAIKRYFYDVKKGIFQYDKQSLNAFSSENYKYYSTLRYIFEHWPANRNASTEFILDCLNTYEKTNQQHFQISDGILDWAIQKAIEVNRPIEMKFYDWLCYCRGGIVINKRFSGFADFEIKYELDDFSFEDESLRKSIHSIVRNNCDRLFHTSTIIRTDPKTGEPVLDKETNEPLTKTIRVDENRWKLKDGHDKRYLDLFVNWEKKPETELDNDVFTPEMVDYSIVRKKVEQYLVNQYGSDTPYISERRPDGIVKMFSYETKMRANLNMSVILGENPGVEIDVVMKRIKDRLVEYFGESLECEYNQSTYQHALTDSLFRLTGDSTECFERKIKTYYKEREIYCAPELSENANLLTGKKCAICQRDMCYVTSIKKSPNWKEYTLAHILDILGYHVLEETDAGYIPTQVYIQFVTQINKAIRFYKRLVCKECGHILFPAKPRGYTRFKCLLPSCSEFGKEIYLSYCNTCKKGVIDSRDTKQCSNGLYVCPDCGSCCSNAFFESQAEKYRIQGKSIPAFISRNIGNGHRDQNMYFCHKCGEQKIDYVDDFGTHTWRCLSCEPIKDDHNSPDIDSEEYSSAINEQSFES